MVDSTERLAVLGIPEAQDLVAEQKVGVVRAVADHVHPELFDKKSLRLGPVAHANVDVVEPEETKFSGRRTARHGRPTTVLRYIRSVRAGRPPAGGSGAHKTAASWFIRTGLIDRSTDGGALRRRGPSLPDGGAPRGAGAVRRGHGAGRGWAFHSLRWARDQLPS